MSFATFATPYRCAECGEPVEPYWRNGFIRWRHTRTEIEPCPVAGVTAWARPEHASDCKCDVCYDRRNEIADHEAEDRASRRRAWEERQASELRHRDHDYRERT